MAERRPLTPIEREAAHALAAAVSAAGLTAEALGPAIGVTAGAVGHWIRGEIVVPLDRVGALAAKVGVAPDAISVRWRQSVAPYVNGSTSAATLSHPARLTTSMIQSAYRMARGAIEARGDSAADYDPATDDIDAALLALAIEEVQADRIESAADGDVLRFARKVNQAGGVNSGKQTRGSNRPDGRTGGAARAKEAGSEGKAPARKPRERVA